MLSAREISSILRANRIVPVAVNNPHGPLGLEQLAEAVRQIQANSEPRQNQVQRPIALPVDAWARLDELAHELGKQQSQRISVSDLVTAFVLEGLGDTQSR